MEHQGFPLISQTVEIVASRFVLIVHSLCPLWLQMS